MAPLKWLTLAGVLVLGACASAAQRRAAETAEIEKEAAKEMRRICALPSLERAGDPRPGTRRSGCLSQRTRRRAPDPRRQWQSDIRRSTDAAPQWNGAYLLLPRRRSHHHRSDSVWKL